MGITDTPYHISQSLTWGNKSLGDRRDTNNPFGWEKVASNLPGIETYNFCRPWVYKQRSDGRIIADLFVCVYHSLTVGLTEYMCWEASRRWVSTCSWLWIQDAYGTVHLPLQSPVPWAGTVANTK